VLSRPNLCPIPSFIFKLLFGEMSMLLLEGQRALPAVLNRHGYYFRYPDIEPALRNLLLKK
jgi:NAD dependent epimerase/dehydratase family enzyme